jgi:NADH oxidase (H2O-forming)
VRDGERRAGEDEAMTETARRDPLELRPGVHWVGVLHPELRVFDALFPTAHGTTYNSYLVQGAEKTAVIDTVKGRFAEPYLERLRTLVDPARIDYVVVNHTEPDHSGALPALLRLCPQATVLCTPMAAGFLAHQLDVPMKIRKVKDGEVVDLGGKHLRFILAPFLHWPDTMFTLLEEDRTSSPAMPSGPTSAARACSTTR